MKWRQTDRASCTLANCELLAYAAYAQMKYTPIIIKKCSELRMGIFAMQRSMERSKHRHQPNSTNSRVAARYSNALAVNSERPVHVIDDWANATKAFDARVYIWNEAYINGTHILVNIYRLRRAFALSIELDAAQKTKNSTHSRNYCTAYKYHLPESTFINAANSWCLPRFSSHTVRPFLAQRSMKKRFGRCFVCAFFRQKNIHNFCSLICNWII